MKQVNSQENIYQGLGGRLHQCNLLCASENEHLIAGQLFLSVVHLAKMWSY